MDDEKVIHRKQLTSAMDKSRETIRRWLKDGTLPKPDVQINRKTMAWKASTLRAAGFNLF